VYSLPCEDGVTITLFGMYFDIINISIISESPVTLSVNLLNYLNCSDISKGLYAVGGHNYYLPQQIVVSIPV